MSHFLIITDHMSILLISLNERIPLISTKEEAIWVNHEMGTCFFELGQFEKARSVGEKAMTESGEAKDMTWYLNASVLVARSECVYLFRGDSQTMCNEV